MDITRYTEMVEGINWHKFDGSEYYKPENVPKSLVSLATVSQESIEGIYGGGVSVQLLLNPKTATDVLFAIGNGHSGTYYSSVRSALPFIIEVALFGNTVVARNCAINILIDLYFFCSEDNSIELEGFVKSSIHQAVSDNKENFLQLAITDKRNKSLIESLIEISEGD